MGRKKKKEKKKVTRRFLAFVLCDEVANTKIRYYNAESAERALYEKIAIYDREVLAGRLYGYYRCFLTVDYELI